MKISEIDKRIPTIFVDMDGVLADLFNYVAEIHDVEHYNHMTRDQWDDFFRDSNAEELFASLPMFKTANDLLKMVIEIFGSYKILSSPLNFDRDGSIRGKNRWLDKHILIADSGRVFEHEKYKHALQPDGTPNVLIDDYRKNIDLWNKASGIGIKFQSDENALTELEQQLIDIRSRF
jgi:hypothetical protein